MVLKKSNKIKLHLPTWDLSDLYLSIKDENIKDDINYCEDAVKSFEKKYKGKLGKLSGDKLFGAIAEYEIIEETMTKVITFAHLKYAEDLSKPENTAFFQNTNEKINDIALGLVFFSLELNKIKDTNLEKLYKSSKNLKKYKPFIRDIRVFKEHELDEKMEQLLLDKSVVCGVAWSRLFDETIDNMTFTYNKKKLTESEIIELMSDKKESVRKKASKVFGKKLGENVKTFAYITNVLAKNKEISDKWRKFKTPISSRNLSNFIEDEVVDALVNTVKKNYPNISHRYYKLKAKMMKKKKLHYTDRNAPLPFDEDKKYTWEEAKNIVLDGYNDFSPEIAKVGKQFFDSDWIDVPPRKGKRGGAFANPSVPSVHPYLLLNYCGKTRDIMTLAHELGHGVHMHFSNEQGYLMSGTPLTLAETASVFGEQLIFRKMLKGTKNKKLKKAMLAKKIEDMINTVVRQIAFLEFEKKVHEERKKGEISIDKLCEFWMSVQKECLGEDIFDFDEEYKYFWTYIPHFIHSPFYVYAYAFGDCLVNSLYSVYLNKEVKDFEKKYINMLKAGGTLHHKELLKPFGLDASKPDFWQKGLNVIIEFINELEKQL